MDTANTSRSTPDDVTSIIIPTLVRRLVEELKPAKIVLFGSYAYGAPDGDSDIDFLVIMDTSDTFLERVSRVLGLVSGLHKGIPLEPIMLTPQEIERRLRIGDQFVGEILERGQVLYEA